MKKLPVLLLSASLLTGALLASCAGNEPEGSSSEPDTSIIDSKEDSIASSEEETPVEPSSSQEVVKKYKLTYEEDSSHPGVTVAFHDGESTDLTELTEAKEGQIVFVNVWDNETQGRSIFKAVLANGVALGHAEQGNFYKLVMPAEDVVITLEYNTAGEDTPSTSHSITYVEDAAHPNTFVNFLGSIDDLESPDMIETAEAGSTVYVMVSYDADTDTISGVFANDTKTTESEDYGWMLSSFTMPDEDVVITLEYSTSGEEAPSASHSITYEEDTAHPDTFVNVAIGDSNLNDFNLVELPTTATAGETIYVNPYNENETVSGVQANGTACETYTFEEVNLFKFAMPDEDVTITITYEK